MSLRRRARRGASMARAAARLPVQAARLASSGMVDLEYYRTLTGMPLASELLAALHYLRSDPGDGYSLHPLFESEYLDRRRRPDAEDPAVRYLTGPAAFRRSPHPLFDLTAARASLGMPDRGGNPWLEWVRGARPSTPVPVPPGFEGVTWGELRHDLLAAAIAWRNRHGSAGPDPRVAGGNRAWVPGMATPLVTVVIATRNQAPILRGALDAVLAQTYRRIEVIVADAGSTDDTAAVAAGVAHFDARVRVVTSAATVLDEAREAARSQARGDHVVLMDAGQLWDDGHLAREVGALLAPAAPPAGAADGEARASAPRAPRTPGRTSVIVPVVADLPAAVDWLELLGGPAPGTELVYSGIATRPQSSVLTVLGRGRSVVLAADPSTGWSSLVNRGALAASGDRLVLIKPGSTLRTADLLSLTAALDDPDVALAQPVAERIDMTVASAGAYFPPGDTVPTPLLAGHPLSDAERLGDARLPAVYSGVVAVRAADFAAVGGLDTAFGNSLAEVDLSLRMLAEDLGHPVLVQRARSIARSQDRLGFPHDLAASARLLRERWVTPPAGSAELLDTVGFTVDGHVAAPLAGTQPTHRGTQVQVAQLARARGFVGTQPTLRWAIDISAPAGGWGEPWGDRHFAVSLAAALGRLGQHVAIDHREARGRASRRYDDVVLTLRGVDQVVPNLGPLNLLWVISHPEDVTPWELEAYDLAFAASTTWSRERSQAWGKVIEPLLQCTDADLFRPRRAGPDSGPPVLFVGNGREGAGRPAVDYALRAGAQLAIYGTGWERTAASNHVIAAGVANEDLGELYCSAGVVLNDHWTDMQVNGFLSNRLFDAVACGARVLSDRIAGAAEVFGSSVQCFEAPSDVARLLADPQAAWPVIDQRLAVAERVRTEHSFDRRAEVLLERALAKLGERSASGPTLRNPPPRTPESGEN